MHTKKIISLIFTQMSFLIILLSSSLNLQAQIKQGWRHLKKSRYDEAIKAFEKDILNPKTIVGIEAEHGLSQIYVNPNYNNYNLDEAYIYAKSAINRYKKLDLSSVHKLQKKNLGILQLQNYQREIINIAYAQAKKEDSYLGYQHFLDVFDGPTPIQEEKITIWRNQKGLELAQSRANWHSFKNIYTKHHESCLKYSPSIGVQLEKDMFETYINERSWRGYATFAAEYPNNIYVKDSVPSIDYRKIATSNELSKYKTFIIGHPNSPFVKLAVDNIYQLTIKSNSIEDHDYFLRIYPTHKKINQLILHYYQLLKEEVNSTTKAKSVFKQMFPNIDLEKLLNSQ